MNSFFNISFADTMRGCLNKAISDAIREYREQGYSDFTRDRKLGMDKMIKFMLTMKGEALTKNCTKPTLMPALLPSCSDVKIWKSPSCRAYWKIIICCAMMKRSLKDTGYLPWTGQPSIWHMMKTQKPI